MLHRKVYKKSGDLRRSIYHNSKRIVCVLSEYFMKNAVVLMG